MTWLTKEVRATRWRVAVSFGMLLGAALLASVAASGEARSKPRNGGVFRVAFLAAARAGGLDHIDPALSYTAAGWSLLDTTCARLMSYPERTSTKGLRLRPEFAAGAPRVMNDSRTFVFTVKRGFKFSNGKRVDANAFAHAIDRAIALGSGSQPAAIASSSG
jgi:peptide/nickel transport system substrate-binding protein